MSRNYASYVGGSFLIVLGLLGVLAVPFTTDASVISPTGCSAVGIWQPAERTFSPERIVPAPESGNVNAALVAECQRVAAELATADSGVGATIAVSEADMSAAIAPQQTAQIVVPIDFYTGSLGSDGQSYGGGLQFRWFPTLPQDSMLWSVQLRAAGMAGSMSVWATDQYVSVVDQEFGSVQCSVLTDLTAEEGQELDALIAALPHEQLATLERPSCAACADGDYDATVQVMHDSTNYTSNNFDLNEPPAALLGLVDTLNAYAVAACADVPVQESEPRPPLPDEPVAEPEPTEPPGDATERQSIQQRIIALLQEVLQLLRLQ